MMNSLYKKINSITHRPVYPFFGSTYWYFILILTILIPSLYFPKTCSSQEGTVKSRVVGSTGLKMTQAIMCEEIKDGRPLNEGLTFSSDLGKISCYTEFDPVPEKTTIYHCWYFKDNLSTRRKLILNPPRWSAFSQIQLRETEKGPWRVDITDDEGNILQTLRFSIIE